MNRLLLVALAMVVICHQVMGNPKLLKKIKHDDGDSKDVKKEESKKDDYESEDKKEYDSTYKGNQKTTSNAENGYEEKHTGYGHEKESKDKGSDYNGCGGGGKGYGKYH